VQGALAAHGTKWGAVQISQKRQGISAKRAEISQPHREYHSPFVLWYCNARRPEAALQYWTGRCGAGAGPRRQPV